MIITRLVSSLAKVFYGEEPIAAVADKLTALKGERVNFQMAVYQDSGRCEELTVEIDSPHKDRIRIYEVRSVPSELPCYDDSDEYYLKKEPGLYPDLLLPCSGSFKAYPKQWRSLWFELLPLNTAGDIEITIRLKNSGGDIVSTEELKLHIVDAVLPEQKLLCTQWFHCDCLSEYYGVYPLSEEHFKLISDYMANYAEYGMNMILTPIFTPPLDTEIGGERPTVQLVKVKRSGNNYSFDYSLLDRFMELAESHGIRNFEMAHFFTQWGAKHAPKIMAETENGCEKIFGWETEASGKEYSEFLIRFIPSLKEHLVSNGRLNNCYFHISDEPEEKDIESYRLAVKTASALLEGCNMIDALSEYRFYAEGLVKTPVPCDNCMEDFIENSVSPLWTYYCCAQHKENVPNRFMAMPSERSRILGTLMFKYKITGFLQWGFNYWFSQLSKELIDPYYTTDAGGAFPSGDAFAVYPGKDGKPVPSIRELVFFEALQDMRAMTLLSEKLGHESVLKFIENTLGEEIDFKHYPHNPELLLKLRERINREIETTLA